MKTFEQLRSECPWYQKRVYYECAANDFDPVCCEANCAPYYFHIRALQPDSFKITYDNQTDAEINKMTEQDLKAMKLHEIIEIDAFQKIQRVYSGWIYITFYEGKVDHIKETFVPEITVIQEHVEPRLK